MIESVVRNSPLKPLLDRVMVARQLASIGAGSLARECGLEFAALDDIKPGRQLLSFFLAGPRDGKATVPEIGCAFGASIRADGVLKRFKQQREQELT